jgi:hypothetical protein
MGIPTPIARENRLYLLICEARDLAEQVVTCHYETE